MTHPRTILLYAFSGKRGYQFGLFLCTLVTMKYGHYRNLRYFERTYFALRRLKIMTTTTFYVALEILAIRVFDNVGGSLSRYYLDGDNSPAGHFKKV